eukprot:jgi/Mesvir1/14563/Mv05245-RA.1
MNDILNCIEACKPGSGGYIQSGTQRSVNAAEVARVSCTVAGKPDPYEDNYNLELDQLDDPRIFSSAAVCALKDDSTLDEIIKACEDLVVVSIMAGCVTGRQSISSSTFDQVKERLQLLRGD